MLHFSSSFGFVKHGLRLSSLNLVGEFVLQLQVLEMELVRTLVGGCTLVLLLVFLLDFLGGSSGK